MRKQQTNKKKILFILCLFSISIVANAQTNPVITSWLRNTTAIKGRHYVANNSTPINDTASANVQSVYYSSSWAYIKTNGVPSYITGPFLDGNISLTTAQNAIFKFPLSPAQNTGTATTTTGGNIGIFINGVALFDYRDGVSWKNSTSALAGGPLGGAGDQKWNRDAVVGERIGFDCAKGHPAMGNYHHHQNPSAFKLDLRVISTVCNLYNADGLYIIDSTQHSPLIGFAYDGFPIYGAYAFKNIDGTGGIARMKSSYKLRNITTRTTWADGTTVLAGPVVSSTYPLGYFREDYQYNTTSSLTPDYLDEHNGRFCVTPEYPNGIYCYFATVDSNWNSAYPYVVGPTFYGVKNVTKPASIAEPVTQYTGSILPINLLSFTGNFANKNSYLQWITTSEKNADYFDIERSANGIKFEKIGRVSAAGNSNSQHNYTFTDISPLQGVNYYRLKQYDYNGSFVYSNVITLKNATNAFEVMVYPNPASDFIAVQVTELLKNNAQVTVSNMKGQVVMQQTIYQGSTICFLETATLYEGVYTISVINGNSKQSFKVSIKH